MASEPFVDLALHVARTDAGIHGTVTSADHPPESFAGWLELTAAIARLLPAAAPPGGRAPEESASRR